MDTQPAFPPRPADPGAVAGAWPDAADPAAAQRLIDRYRAIGPDAAAFADRPDGGAILQAIGGNSPYLAELALREASILPAVIADGADAVMAAVLARLAQTRPDARGPEVVAALRRAKRQAALAIALADIGGLWSLAQVVAALSALAEATLCLAVDHLLLAAAGRGELRLADPGRPSLGSGFIVLGMGKLGAGELNYSSDIDLVLIYDPAAHGSDHAPAMGLASCFSRLAQGLVALMQQRDADGYVFRTDLRLRPDPAATPPAVSLPAALAYYESLGQNWERAAMLKARPVAGDIAAGDAFLAAIRPFIWRRGLDFAAVADIHGMKRRIDRHRGTGPAGRIAGFDLKLGRGGIREIEFLVQTLQLVWGGRDPSLRDNATLGGMAALVRAGHLGAAAAAALAEAYRWLRRAEHRIQMVADRQTHALPDQPAALARFAIFLGLPDDAALAAVLLRHVGRVCARYAEVFEAVPDAGACAGLDFTGPDAHAATLDQLGGLGFADPGAIVAAVQGWQAGRVRALRSDRARGLMHDLLPPLLAALAAQPQPDAAFHRFDLFLGRLPAGVQLLSLIQRNPALLARIAAVLGAAPWLADHLARVPDALEGLLSPGSLPGPARMLEERLTGCIALDEAIGIIRRSVHELDFALSVDTLEGRLDADAGGLARAALADAAIRALLPRVLADIKRRFGTVPGGGVAVVALGKAGSREMMAGSDLDLMLIYDHAPDAAESRVRPDSTARAVPVAQYYTRMAQSFIAAVTAPGAEGPLYAIDMRLRPSGNAGPVAVSLQAFRRYHREHAWTWERMAMTRARVVAGPPVLTARVQAALAEVVSGAAAVPTLEHDAAAMRARLARDLPATDAWDVKHRLGGLMEVEFIAQVMTLRHGAAHPAIVHPTTRTAFAGLQDAGLLAAGDAALLTGADHLWRTIQGMLRVTVGKATDAVLPAASADALLRAVAAPAVTDQPGLHAHMDAVAAAVRSAFTRLVGAPDPALLEKTPMLEKHQ